ncbi:hypothetical protein KBC77_01495 [Candidatus Saccharibacteria bacterium]|nr:hypothetical protein [Candidatus Saccharibacteria bacterium]
MNSHEKANKPVATKLKATKETPSLTTVSQLAKAKKNAQSSLTPPTQSDTSTISAPANTNGSAPAQKTPRVATPAATIPVTNIEVHSQEAAAQVDQYRTKWTIWWRTNVDAISPEGFAVYWSVYGQPQYPPVQNDDFMGSVTTAATSSMNALPVTVTFVRGYGYQIQVCQIRSGVCGVRSTTLKVDISQSTDYRP